MAEIVPIKLYITESSYVGIDNRPTTTPYKRVVGMSVGDGMPQEMWTPARNRNTLEVYTPSDVDMLEIEATERFASRLSSFFSKYFVEGPKQPPQPEIPGVAYEFNPERYLTNCHRFGYWMRGSAVAQLDALPDAPDFIVQDGIKSKPNFQLGQHAVLGSGAAVHSVVGLGLDTEDCIQVLGTGSNLGIDTYENTLAYYDPGQKKGFAYFV